MAYDRPSNVSYVYPAKDFTAAITRAIKPPYLKNRGIIVDIHVAVTTLFTQVTTPAYVRVGTAASDALYAELNMGAAAANTAYNVTDFPTAIKKTIDLSRDAVTAVQLKIVAPTGGSPAGVGDLTLTIGWS